MSFKPWTLDKLLDANESLNLKLDPELIGERFSTFGGSARWFLDDDECFDYEEIKVDLHAKARQIKTLDKLDDCLNAIEKTEEISHNIFHYHPLKRDKPPYATSYETCFASPQVCQWVHQSINNCETEQLERLLKVFTAAPKQFSTMRGFLFEHHCARTLIAGGDFAQAGNCYVMQTSPQS